jgi:hypothetical protein
LLLLLLLPVVVLFPIRKEANLAAPIRGVQQQNARKKDEPKAPSVGRASDDDDDHGAATTREPPPHHCNHRNGTDHAQADPRSGQELGSGHCRLVRIVVLWRVRTLLFFVCVYVCVLPWILPVDVACCFVFLPTRRRVRFFRVGMALFSNRNPQNRLLPLETIVALFPLLLLLREKERDTDRFER